MSDMPKSYKKLVILLSILLFAACEDLINLLNSDENDELEWVNQRTIEYGYESPTGDNNYTEYWNWIDDSATVTTKDTSGDETVIIYKYNEYGIRTYIQYTTSSGDQHDIYYYFEKKWKMVKRESFTNGVLDNTSEYEWDGLTRTYYGQDGTKSLTGKYDKYGRLLEQTFYNSDGSVGNVYTYEWDDSHLRRQLKMTITNDEIVLRKTECNWSDNLGECTNYDGEGVVLNTFDLEVGEYDEVIVSTTYNLDGSLMYRYTYVYDYDNPFKKIYP